MIRALVSGSGCLPIVSAATAISSTAMTTKVMTSRKLLLASLALAWLSITAGSLMLSRFAHEIRKMMAAISKAAMIASVQLPSQMAAG